MLDEQTPDQILLLVCDKRDLQNPKRIKGTPDELISRGLLKHDDKIPRGMSLSEWLREQKKVNDAKEAKRRKKERRRERIAAIKRQQEHGSTLG